MKKIVCLFLSCLALMSSSFLFASNANKEGKNVKLLFVMFSKEAAIQETSTPGTYVLSLKKVDPKVIYFSNRPKRISGQLMTQQFINQWGKGAFDKVAPNALMEAVIFNESVQKPKNKISYPIILKKPIYFSPKNNEIQFEIKALPGSVTPLPVDSRTYDYVAIFIDDICLSCIG